ncbi:putative GTP-binding protein EngB [compost metagenome]
MTVREPLKLVLLIIDLRHPPSKDDELMYDWLKHYDLPVCVVATKADKIPKSRWQKHIKIIKDALVMRAGDELIMFSSEAGIGKDQLWSLIGRHISDQDSEVLEESPSSD